MARPLPWLLAVIVAAALVPLLIRGGGKDDGCWSNLKEIDSAISRYWLDHDRVYPGGLQALVPAYLPRIPSCPVAGEDTYTAGYQTHGTARNPAFHYTVACHGTHHGNSDHPSVSRPVTSRAP